MKQFLLFVAISTLLLGCSAIKETSTLQMQTGLYKINKQKTTSYVVVSDENILTYPITKNIEDRIADSAQKTMVYTKVLSNRYQPLTTFSSGSLDVDVLTIAFKYRPYTAGFPNQFNTNFNAAGYFGHRSNRFILSFDKNPLGTYQPNIKYFGYSLGVFAGLGATAINPFVTNNMVNAEYDGLVITKGIAALIGLGNLTFGAAIGFDHLMDKNHRTWIYQSKPWIGFTIGLNLN